MLEQPVSVVAGTATAKTQRNKKQNNDLLTQPTDFESRDFLPIKMTMESLSKLMICNVLKSART